MGGHKSSQLIELNDDQFLWLQKMTEEYGLADTDKALRIVLDYIVDVVEPSIVFEEVRCNHCNDSSNQD